MAFLQGRGVEWDSAFESVGVLGAQGFISPGGRRGRAAASSSDSGRRENGWTAPLTWDSTVSGRSLRVTEDKTVAQSDQKKTAQQEKLPLQGRGGPAVRGGNLRVKRS